MKKVTLRFSPEMIRLAGYDDIDEYFTYIEKVADFRSFDQDNFFIVRVRVTEKIDDIMELIGHFGVKDIFVLDADHPEYLVLYRCEESQFLSTVFTEMDHDMHFTRPEYYDGESYVASFLLPGEKLSMGFDLLREIGVEFEVVSVAPAGEVVPDGLPKPTLTPKQHEVLELAFSRGYFEMPRKVSAKTLAAELGISAQMFYKHIRRAQQRLVKCLLPFDTPR